MKIIAFGDIHMVTSPLSEIKDLRNSDLVIVTGDITNFGHKEDAKIVLNEILRYNPHLLCLAGNLDNSDINDYLENLEINLHGQAHIIKRKLCVYGVGGSNHTPFRTPWEFSENELKRAADDAYTQAKELIALAEPLAGHRIPTLFVSHTPPYGTCLDRLRNSRHVGSKAIRKCIENNSPDLCLTGHIHESKGQDMIGRTRIINPGMLMKKGWVVIDVQRTKCKPQLQ